MLKALERKFVWTNLEMLILYEAFHRLRTGQFLLNVDGSKYDKLWQRLKDLEWSTVEPRFFELPRYRQSSSKNWGFEKSEYGLTPVFRTLTK